MTGDYFAAQDLAQETFLSAFCHLDSFDGAQEKAWLCRIASNKCVDYLRARPRTAPQETEELDRREGQMISPFQYAEEQELLRQLEQRCSQLRPPYDTVARYYFCEERSPAEIAQLCGQKLKTTQTQIRRAREMLRAVYGEYRKEVRSG